MDVPKDAFNYFLDQKIQFEQYFKVWAIRMFAERRIDIRIDSRRVHNAWLLWKHCCGVWGRELHSRKMDKDPKTKKEFVALDAAAHKLSHSKLAGALLWSLNKTQPISDLCSMSDARAGHLTSHGFGIPESVISSKLTFTFYNERSCVEFVNALFWSIQEGRGIAARIDLTRPPMDRHYLQDFCYYLRNCNPSVIDLYMTYKTLDIFSLEHPQK